MQQLWQYDLSSLDCTAIRNSKTLLREDSSMYGNISALKVLAQGPDGKIYYRHFWKHNYLGRGERPDEIGLACYVQNGYLTLNDTFAKHHQPVQALPDSEMPWTLGVAEMPGPERAVAGARQRRLAPGTGSVFMPGWTDA
ncbi:MAG: hypothetical protein IPG74_00630 [Flavobacteriales bacterium]|nr:hypothetical protein [Flavobacteriales bacterium]